VLSEELRRPFHRHLTSDGIFSFYHRTLTSLHTVDREPNAKKTKRTKVSSGVKSNWDKVEVLIPPPQMNRTSSSSNAFGRRSVSSVSAEPAFQQGGISSGEDELEHREIVSQTAMRYRVCQTNLKFIR
jgi:hypothetical protein